MPERGQFELEDSLGFLTQRLGRIMHEALRKRLKEHSLAPVDWSAMFCCARHAATPGEIASRLRVARSIVSRSLERLESRGLIRRLGGGDDQRSARIDLTDYGRKLLPKLNAAAEEVNQAFAGTLDERELRRVSELLARLLDSADQATPAESS